MYIGRIVKIVLIIFLLVFYQTSFACSVDSSGPMPVCEAPIFEDDERIVVLRLGQMSQYTNIDVTVEPYGGELNTSEKPIFTRGVWDSLGRKSFDQHTYVADIKIGSLEAPVTLVLSSYDATIIRLSGKIQNVDRVVVLGSRRYGPGAIGVVGIEKNKVEYVSVKGRDETRRTICSAPPQSCIPSQFLDVYSANRGYRDIHRDMKPYDNLKDVSASSSVMKEYKGKPITVGMFSGTDIINIVENKSGVQINLDTSRQDLLNANFTSESWKATRTQHGAYGSFLYNKVPPEKDIDPNAIISPFKFKPSKQLPGWHGIEALQNEGALLLRTDWEFKTRYDEIVARSEEWQGDKKLKMDIILLKNIEVLPRELRDVMQTLVIYVPDGITPPKIPTRSSACYFYETEPPKLRGGYNHACRNLANRY